MNILEDFWRFVRPWRTAPRRRARWELRCLIRAILPNKQNNDFRKVTTTGLFGVWILLTLGYGPGTGSDYYIVITAAVFMILGQQWELEKMQIGPFQISSGQSGESDGGS